MLGASWILFGFLNLNKRQSHNVFRKSKMFPNCSVQIKATAVAGKQAVMKMVLVVKSCK